MATVINTTNVGLSELESAPGGGNTPVSFNTSGRKGWNEGNRGSQTVAFFTWGYGNGSSGNLDPIYGLTPPTSGTNPPLEIGDWRGLQYWFDGTEFDIKVGFKNNVTPTPPDDFVSIQMVITDSTGNYSIFSQSPNSPPDYEIFVTMYGGDTFTEKQIPGFVADEYVLAKNLYWYIEVAAGIDFPGGILDMSINGVSLLNETLPPGDFSELYFNWETGGAGETDPYGCSIQFTVD